jgi:hypothetical protein
MRYLMEEAEREYKAVRMLATMPFMAAGVLGPTAGLDADFCWYVLRFKKKRLGPLRDGDIDLIAGPLELEDQTEFVSLFVEARKSRYDWHPTQVALLTAARMADKGRIKWPPSTNKLVAIEAQCDFQSAPTSGPQVAYTRARISSLLRMGFDRVALLDIIANPPVSGLDGQTWVTAPNDADFSRQALVNDFKHRLPVHSPAGHYVWPVGDDETQRETGPPVELQSGTQNPLLKDEDVKACRAAISNSLHHELGKLPAPRSLRAVFVDCEKCGRIHSDLDVCKSIFTGDAERASSSRDCLVPVGTP